MKRHLHSGWAPAGAGSAAVKAAIGMAPSDLGGQARTLHTGNMLRPETRATKAANRRAELARHANVPSAVLTLAALREASANAPLYD